MLMPSLIKVKISVAPSAVVTTGADPPGHKYAVSKANVLAVPASWINLNMYVAPSTIFVGFARVVSSVAVSNCWFDVWFWEKIIDCSDLFVCCPCTSSDLKFFIIFSICCLVLQ